MVMMTSSGAIKGSEPVQVIDNTKVERPKTSKVITFTLLIIGLAEGLILWRIYYP